MSIIDEISAERQRQIDVEGHSRADDDEHAIGGQLAAGAAAYCEHAWLFLHSAADELKYRIAPPSPRWPWSRYAFKPKDPRRDLIRAAALIVAEVERLDRATAKENPEKDSV